MRSPRTLKILSMLVWFLGVFFLVLKAGKLLFAAHDIHPSIFGLSIAILIGVIAGLLKAVYLFRKACEKNLDRIDALPTPQPWQCFKGRFWVFMTCMILLGRSLSIWAQGQYIPLLSVAALDLSIGVALLVSSKVFWEQRAFSVQLESVT